MLINNYEIFIFDPEFALNRISWPEPIEGEYSCLRNEVSKYSTTQRTYVEGDKILYRERDYHKYPARVAVVFEADKVFKLQTFKDGVVGKLYDNILEQADEIRPFFDCEHDEILVLENRYGRNLPKDLDLIIKYIKLTLKAYEEYSSNQSIANEYVIRYNQIVDKTIPFIDRKPSEELQCLQRLTHDFLNEIFNLIETVNQKTFSKITRFFEPLPDDERLYITFGLYYCFLKKGLNSHFSYRRSAMFSAFLHEMHIFLSDNPGIAEEYCDYMDYPHFERKTIERTLEKEGLTRDRWIFAADDLL